MSILIKGMKMPKNCKECFACKAELSQEKKVIYVCCFAQTDCPLIIVPPHGRLIDADALDTEILQAGFSYALTRRKLRYTPGDVRQKIANAPTIIPAEEGEP